MRKFLIVMAFALAASPAAAAWREARSAHFIIYSEDKPDALRAFATRLERFDAALRFLLKLPAREESPHNRLTVFAVSSIQDVQRIGGGGGMAGFYVARAGHSAAVVPRRTGSTGRGDMTVDTVLLHEYTHHFLDRNLPGAFPTWFSEGLAEFNSTTRFNDDDSVDVGLPAQHRSFEIMHLARLPIKLLLDGDYSKMQGDQIYALYGRGWLLTHYLQFAPERKGQLETYLAELGKGRPNLDAAQTAFGDLDQLGRDLERYKNKRDMSYARVPPGKLQVGAVDVRELSPGASDIMRVFMRSKLGIFRGGGEKALAADARKIARDHPDDPFVLLALADAEIDAGNYAAADEALDTILAAQPDHVQALVYRGTSAVRQLKAAKSSDAEAWKAARRWYIRASHLDPAAPEPLQRFYLSFLAANEKPTENAASALVAAYLLAPEDDRLRLIAARQLLRDGKQADARTVLAPAAFSPHGAGTALVRGLLESLDKGGAPAALALWDGEEAKAKQKAESERAD